MTTPEPKPAKWPCTTPAHTPGPWRLVDELNVWSDSGVRVTNVCHGNHATNARLIAAAPALLAALEAIHEAGRMSSQPRAVYCALIAEDALIAAKGAK